MPIPNLNYLLYFCDSVRLQSLSAAARKHRVTASAVSRAIKQLEVTFGVELVKHRKNSFVPTEEGLRLAQESETIFSALRQTAEAVRTDDETLRGWLNIGTSQSIVKAGLGKALAKLAKDNPDLSVKLHLATGPRLRDMLEGGELDCVVTIDSPVFHAFQSQEISTGEFIAVRPKSSQNPASAFIVTEPRPELAALAKAYRARYKAELPIRMEVGSWEIICELVHEGLGVGYVPDFMIRRGSPWAKVLSRKRLDVGKVSYTLSVFYRPRLAMQRATSRLIEVMLAKN